MRHAKLPRFLPFALLAACLLVPDTGRATTHLQMDLEKLCDSAGRIFRGTVLNARTGSIDAGGGRIPTVTYAIQVEETFKGDVQSIKGRRIVELRMVGKADTEGSASARFNSVLADLPRLAIGKNYLLITTRPSAAGLVTTVGLGQGAFSIFGKAGEEQAVNAYDNRGLFKEDAAPSARAAAAAGPSAPGPVAYALLAERIRAIVDER